MKAVPRPPFTTDPDRFLKCREALAGGMSVAIALSTVRVRWRPEKCIERHGTDRGWEFVDRRRFIERR